MTEHKYSIRVEAKDNASSELKKLRDELGRLRDIDAFVALKKQAEQSKVAFSEAQQRINALAREMKSGGGDAKELAKSFEAAKIEAQKLKAGMLADRDALHAMRKSLQESGIATRDLATEQARLREAAEKTRKVVAAQALLGVRPYRDIQEDILKTRRAYDTLKESGRLSAVELEKAHQQMRKRIGELSKETNGWSEAIGSVRTGILALAAGGYALVKSFSGYSSFAQRMAEVNTLVDISRERFKALSEEVQETTRRIPQTADELAAAEYDIISAGVALEKSIGVLEKAGKAAVGGVTDTKTAAGVGMAVINAYGMEIDRLGHVYDVLFTTVKLGVTTFPQLAQSLGEVLPTARATETGLVDVSAAIAAMTKAGIQTPKAVTALKGALNALAAPTPEARKQFEALGITWTGLIPTLEALKAKALSFDQMRMLIPDVEARTGVLSMIQNFDTLKATIAQMAASGGALDAAYDKMKDTPENQLKLFRNEISIVTHDIGELIAVGLLPAAKAVSFLIRSLSEADPVTKAFVGSLAALGVGAVAWNLGIGTLVIGLKGMVVQARAAAVALTATGTSSTAAGIAIKSMGVLAAAYGVVQIGLLVYELYQLRKANQAAAEAQNSLMENTGRLMARLDEFKNFRLPENFAAMPTDQVDKFKQSLMKARTYWVAMKAQLETRAAETSWLGTSTEQAREARAELGKVNERLTRINADLTTVSATSQKTGTTVQQSVAVGTKALEEFEEEAKKAYEEAANRANEYADKVIALEDRIRQSRMSTEDKIRELRQRTMTDEEAYADRQEQIQEKLSAARAAAAAKDYDAAEGYYKEVISLAERSVGEVKSAGENETVVVPMDVSIDQAVKTIETAGQEMQRLVLEPQKAAAQQSYEAWRSAAEKMKADLDAAAAARTAAVEIDLTNYEAMRKRLDDLVRTETKTIIIKTVRQEEHAAGGMIGMAGGGYLNLLRGGRLPGFGGGDRRRILGEDGEYMIRKEAVARYGAGLFEALNSMRVKLPEIFKARVGGMIPRLRVPLPGFAAGGPLTPTEAESVILELRAGNASVTTRASGGRAAVKALEKELVRMGLSYAG